MTEIEIMNASEIMNTREEVSYQKLKDWFRSIEQEIANGSEQNHANGWIVFTEDSFEKPYSLEERTYLVSSNNKAFMPNMGGYSIYGNSLDGSDTMVRLEQYMCDEKGGPDGWKIEACYIDAIPFPTPWRKRFAEWKDSRTGSEKSRSKCGSCSETSEHKTPFCPFCGVTMTNAAVFPARETKKRRKHG